MRAYLYNFVYFLGIVVGFEFYFVTMCEQATERAGDVVILNYLLNFIILGVILICFVLLIKKDIDIKRHSRHHTIA